MLNLGAESSGLSSFQLPETRLSDATVPRPDILLRHALEEPGRPYGRRSILTKVFLRHHVAAVRGLGYPLARCTTHFSVLAFVYKRTPVIAMPAGKQKSSFYSQLSTKTMNSQRPKRQAQKPSRYLNSTPSVSPEPEVSDIPELHRLQKRPLQAIPAKLIPKDILAALQQKPVVLPIQSRLGPGHPKSRLSTRAGCAWCKEQGAIR
jgi:hypothetical protein